MNIVKQPSGSRDGSSKRCRPDSTLKVRLFNQSNSLNPKIIDSKHVKNLKYKHNDSLSTASSLFPSIRNTESLNNKYEDGKIVSYNLDHLQNNNNKHKNNKVNDSDDHDIERSLIDSNDDESL